MPRAVRAGMAFIGALDQGALGGLQRLCAPDATWWVDTGPDRRAGLAPAGSGRFPLHGLMAMDAKLALMRELGPGAFPTGCRQIPRRIVAGDDWCVIEVDGDGLHASGKRYANRYGFVFDVDGRGAITSVREYLDTWHAQDVIGAGAAIPPTAVDREPEPGAPLPAPVGELWPALARGDIDGFAALFTEDAVWWTDTGPDRRLGRLHGRGDVHANGPFHGNVAMADKLAQMRKRIADGAYRTPAVTVTPHRWIRDDTLVAIEASGDAVLAGEKRYQNRYLWVVEVREHRIAAVREYCDTAHLKDVL
ncbi:nuclear transport factor 2 family protein [Dactylosporangium sp. CS-047395]|uniref:nuclear transport factor 2 family protein n=1 Tax=Dactylosporangium sp. CS-047395 TaxID=3239936 RepID=UPI003D8B6F96